jgi:hypothetical protein
VDLVERWWNRQRDPSTRRDIWLTTDGTRWHVRARHGVPGREVNESFSREYEARAMLNRLINTAPGDWQNITLLVTKPRQPRAGTDIDALED